MNVLPESNTIYQMGNTIPSKTYYINRNTNRISGYIDDKDAIVQAIYLILSTERYESYIYNWYYGVELDSLVGKDRDFVKSELKRRIAEALLEDDRILDVTDFDITFDKDKANAKSTGGSWTSGSTTLTAAQSGLPSHNHSFSGVNDGAGTTYNMGSYPAKIYQDYKPNWTGYYINNEGGWNASQGHTHSITPPYFKVYMWYRTA
jgi:hypothetical protein